MKSPHISQPFILLDILPFVQNKCFVYILLSVFLAKGLFVIGWLDDGRDFFFSSWAFEKLELYGWKV